MSRMSISDTLANARQAGFGIAAFNCASFESMHGVALAGRDLTAPVIIQTSARLVRRHGPAIPKGWFTIVRQNIWEGCFLHLDHCADISLIKTCIDAGWDMVMFDGSSLPLEENCRKSMELVTYAHARGVAVEGEVGGIMGEEDGYVSHELYADPASIFRMALSGVDCLAVGFGNVHGNYSDKSLLKWEIFEEAGIRVPLPLVLHGGSGLTEAEFCRAIRAGAAKINISTELKRVYDRLQNKTDELELLAKEPSALHTWLTNRFTEVAAKYIQIFRTKLI